MFTMRSQSPKPKAPLDSLSVKLGGWFEAHATGKGVLAIPVVVLILAAAAALKLVLGS
jgi:hypothetical protein